MDTNLFFFFFFLLLTLTFLFNAGVKEIKSYGERGGGGRRGRMGGGLLNLQGDFFNDR